MDLLKQLIRVDDSLEQPVYLQITNAFIHHIQQGRLRAGLKLPGSREAASTLQINRMTMVAAYRELEAQGWIELLPRKGSFVSTSLPQIKPSQIMKGPNQFTYPVSPGFPFNKNKVVPVPSGDFPSTGKLIFNDGFPDVRLAPVEDLAKCMRRLGRLSSNKKYMMYGGAQGTTVLRETLSDFLCDTRGLSIKPGNILVTRGAQMGIYIAASIVLQPGDHMIAGTPGYRGANLTFQQLKANIHHVPVEDDGIDVDAIERICKKKTIKMVYVISHHHNPTTVTLSPDKRLRLLALAAKYRFAILEDDYDYDFHYASKPVMPMASLDRNGSVIYIGSLTKTIAPSIRFGFMIAPLNFIDSAVHFRKYLDTQGDSLMENAIAELYKDGTIERHIKKSVRLYRERRDHLCELLQQELPQRASFRIPDGGMSVWTSFPGADLIKTSARALKKGLVIADGTKYDIGNMKYNSVRLGFASLNFSEQERAIAILKDALI